MDNQFQLLDTIIKSRLLSFNDDGYEEFLGIDVDSFRKRYKDAPDDKLEPIMDNFSKAFENFDAFGPRYMIESYIRASDVFKSVDFDWGKNRQLVSRKKFCRWMFRQAYLNNPELYEEDYSPNREDWELIRLFKPDPKGSREEIDIVFTMLLTFQVIKPFCSGSMRALQYGSPAECREKMIELLKLLQEDLPAFGVLKNLHSMEQAFAMLNEQMNDGSPIPPAALWGILNDISCDLDVSSSPEELLDSHVEHGGYLMKGIWIDDSEEQQKRFWLFPNNRLMAFCFYYSNGEWILNPYEFAFYKQAHEFEFEKTCSLVTSRGNMQILLNGKIEKEEWVRLVYRLEDWDEDDDFQTIRFEPESASGYPYWMNWRCFKRLPLDHRLTKEYMEIIDKIYNESEMLRGFDFRDIGLWLTDSHSSLVGIDEDFMYLSDMALT